MAWAPNYCTASELAAFVRISDNADDTQLSLAIAAASRSVDLHTKRQFGLVSVAEARTYTAHYDVRRDRWAVPVDDFMSTSGLVVKFDSAGDESYLAEITDYGFRPANAVTTGWPWTELVILSSSTVTPTDADNAISVTARWGWTTVPDAVKQACLLQASRLLSRRDSPFGVAGSPQTGSEIRLLAKVDPDVAVALRPYVRPVPTAVFA